MPIKRIEPIKRTEYGAVGRRPAQVDFSRKNIYVTLYLSRKPRISTSGRALTLEDTGVLTDLLHAAWVEGSLYLRKNK